MRHSIYDFFADVISFDGFYVLINFDGIEWWTDNYLHTSSQFYFVSFQVGNIFDLFVSGIIILVGNVPIRKLC